MGNTQICRGCESQQECRESGSIGSCDEIPDEKNPELIFTGVDTALLVGAINDHFDLHVLARQTLRNRGLDDDGNFIGFDEN